MSKTLPGLATSVRWRIVALVIAFSFLSWFRRKSISVAYDERIHDQYQISTTAMGQVYSTFLFVYAVCMTPGGWFIDRFGTRKSLFVMGVGLAVFCALTGLVGWAVGMQAETPGWLGVEMTAGGLAFVLFMVIRSVMGGFAAPMYPAAAQVVADWIPFHHRSAANGLVQGAACVGIAFTPLLFGSLIDRFDWPVAFLVLAAVTGVLALVWAVSVTDRPEQHRGVNEAEVLLIHGQEPPQRGAIGGSWLRLLRNRSLVFLTASYAAVGYFEYLFFFWMDFYFKETLHLSDEVRRIYSAIAFLSIAAGMVVGGWLSDWMVKRYGRRRGRGAVVIAGLLGAGVFLLPGVLPYGAEWTVTWFSLALFSVGMVEAPTWTTAQELGGRQGGTAAGICNTGGNAGGILSPMLTPLIADYAGWPVAILVASVVCVYGACLWLWIDPQERVSEH